MIFLCFIGTKGVPQKHVAQLSLSVQLRKLLRVAPPEHGLGGTHISGGNSGLDACEYVTPGGDGAPDAVRGSVPGASAALGLVPAHLQLRVQPALCVPDQAASWHVHDAGEQRHLQKFPSLYET